MLACTQCSAALALKLGICDRPPRLGQLGARCPSDFCGRGCPGKPINFYGLLHSLERQCDVTWLRCNTPKEFVSSLRPVREVHKNIQGCFETVAQPSFSHVAPVSCSELWRVAECLSCPCFFHEFWYTPGGPGKIFSTWKLTVAAVRTLSTTKWNARNSVVKFIYGCQLAGEIVGGRE